MIASCIQLSIRLCKRRENLTRALALAAEAVGEGADVLVFPELFLTGFCYEEDLSDRPPYPSLDPLRSFVEEYGCMMVGSIVDGRLNRGFCLDESGIGLQEKIHPFGPEKDHFDGGGSISPIKTSKGRIGLSICYDLRFPEVARKLALSGADFLVTIAQFPASRGYHWQTLCRARAIENQIPHLACNAAGPEFCGGSAIIDAWGTPLAEAGSGERVILAEVDLAGRDLIREQIPALKDRRPEIYRFQKV
ncbi:nitrilase-related carbon-nitrogen hydrolase [Methanocrinis sp.]|uniref:nitrilase-related carbon-nitrogen hydrolase n=1 Tax=Methanocrinis sp. TaxID=3101522 RepID=UPI003D0E9576